MSFAMSGDGEAFTDDLFFGGLRRMVLDNASLPIRVLLCKSGLEEHDRGVRYVARKLVESGMEVIYIVFHNPEEVATIAVQERVNLLGISSSAGGHLSVVRRIQESLQELGEGSLPILIGGIIPDADRPKLAEMGVIGVFGPGSRPSEIVEAVRNSVLSSREP